MQSVLSVFLFVVVISVLDAGCRGPASHEQIDCCG